MLAVPPPDMPAAAVEALRTIDVEHLLLPVLYQLVVIIAVARLAGVVARRVGQPTAVGEIIAGLLLGPSLFGWVAPDLSAALFKPSFAGVPQELVDAAFPKIFTVLAQIGLIFLLFLIGLEFEFSHLKARGAATLAVSLSGIAMPFALGSGLAAVAHGDLEVGPNGPVSRTGLSLFMGVAMSITAIPILGRMMIELGINRTKLGAVVISAAAVDDAAGWILLATIATVVRTGFDPGDTAVMAASTAAFLAAMVFVARPLLVRYFAWALGGPGGQPTLTTMAVVLILLLACAIVTNLIGIFSIFGAFLLGAVLSDQTQFREAVAARLRDLVTAFFLPIFFTYTGLNTNVAAIHGPDKWLIFAGVMGAAVFGKFGGCGLAAYLTGSRPREAAIIGVMMNTRALMELIVINIGSQLGVIPPSLFAMLVLMAIITTVMTTPILLLLRFGTEIEAPIAASGFLRRPRPVPAPEVAGVS